MQKIKNAHLGMPDIQKVFVKIPQKFRKKIKLFPCALIWEYKTNN